VITLILRRATVFDSAAQVNWLHCVSLPRTSGASPLSSIIGFRPRFSKATLFQKRIDTGFATAKTSIGGHRIDAAASRKDLVA